MANIVHKTNAGLESAEAMKCPSDTRTNTALFMPQRTKMVIVTQTGMTCLLSLTQTEVTRVSSITQTEVIRVLSLIQTGMT